MYVESRTYMAYWPGIFGWQGLRPAPRHELGIRVVLNSAAATTTLLRYEQGKEETAIRLCNI